MPNVYVKVLAKGYMNTFLKFDSSITYGCLTTNHMKLTTFNTAEMTKLNSDNLLAKLRRHQPTLPRAFSWRGGFSSYLLISTNTSPLLQSLNDLKRWLKLLHVFVSIATASSIYVFSNAITHISLNTGFIFSCGGCGPHG